MHRFFTDEVLAEQMQITGSDAHHIADVLRMRKGDELQIVTADQQTALMSIEAVAADKISLRLQKIEPALNEPQLKITLAEGLPKGDKFELVIQKAVELGVTKIVPLAMDNCVVQLKGDKAGQKQARWQKIAAAAAQQSKRDIIPEVCAVQSLSAVLQSSGCEVIIMAYECEQECSLKAALQQHPECKSVLLIIGPEGGISKEEYLLAQKCGAQTVSLGRRILRTETAAVALLAAVAYEFDEFGGRA